MSTYHIAFVLTDAQGHKRLTTAELSASSPKAAILEVQQLAIAQGECASNVVVMFAE